MQLKANPAMLFGAWEFYRDHPVEFINHWVDTYDPRNSGSGMPARLPLVLFERQADLVYFIMQCLFEEENGLIEKCRDMGATWVCCALSVWLWIFWPGVSVGWGSRKEILVDKIGDPDSIFEKMRMIILGLPKIFWPQSFNPQQHSSYMKLYNPLTGATITGEAGDNIGRGGRKRIYFKDESAHYERPEKIEAALADNTRVQIDISSVNGVGNVFHRRRENGVVWEGQVTKGATNVFIMDWRDHPAKDQAWYEGRKKKAIADGLLHIFYQEVDRNYAAAIEGVIIHPDWIEAAIDADKKLGFDDSGPWCAALDVADEGRDKNAWAARKGVVLKQIAEWNERDPGVAARNTVGFASKLKPIDVQYDSIGLGVAVKSEINRLEDENLVPAGVSFIPWAASAKVLFPDGRVIEDDENSPLNKDFFQNLKAQGWWELQRRFEKTYMAVTQGIKYDPDELISIPSDLPLIYQVKKELTQPVFTKSGSLKLMVDKTPEGTRSPNLADAIMMCYWPIRTEGYTVDDLRKALA